MNMNIYNVNTNSSVLYNNNVDNLLYIVMIVYIITILFFTIIKNVGKQISNVFDINLNFNKNIKMNEDSIINNNLFKKFNIDFVYM